MEAARADRCSAAAQGDSGKRRDLCRADAAVVQCTGQQCSAQAELSQAQQVLEVAHPACRVQLRCGRQAPQLLQASGVRACIGAHAVEAHCDHPPRPAFRSLEQFGWTEEFVATEVERQQIVSGQGVCQQPRLCEGFTAEDRQTRRRVPPCVIASAGIDTWIDPEFEMRELLAQRSDRGRLVAPPPYRIEVCDIEGREAMQT